MTVDERFLATMGGPRPSVRTVTVERADGGAVSEHRALRRWAFVERQQLFAGHDLDDHDDDPATVVLLARAADGHVVGGVRLHPHPDGLGLGWWRGSRLVVAPDAPPTAAPALVRAATATALNGGAVRFDATVQPGATRLFERLGWYELERTTVAGRPHHLMAARDDRTSAALHQHKLPIGRLLADLAPGGAGFVGDDAAPVPGSGLVAACDAVLPAMVERDPWWAGWCSVVVNVNDLAAMGARPVGLLDAVAGRSEAHVAEVLAGVRAAADAYGVPLLGGHTQLQQHGSLAVTALGRAAAPVPAGGGRPGDDVCLTADLGGAWRPGYAGRQWDSTTHRTPAELQALVATLAEAPTAAAKDVSMAGLVGTLAMLAEASGTGAVVDVASVPRPSAASLADWLACFPGFALLSADRPGRWRALGGTVATTATIGRLTDEPGVVGLRWPDGLTTTAVRGPATGLGAA